MEKKEKGGIQEEENEEDNEDLLGTEDPNKVDL